VTSCRSWGIAGKNLYLLDLLRRRMEYPELKRELHAQYERFRPSVVLIEDKASGTQLIQELVAEGRHAVTRYQPQADKVMRIHAQTQMIKNGFVHVPNTAPWLAQYLHELTSFPNGRHDDQIDLTAQMLDWFKRGAGPSSNAGSRASGFGSLQRRLADSDDAGSHVVLQFLLLLLSASVCLRAAAAAGPPPALAPGALTSIAR
jgi:predicted phage terminase large subunit-like protein